MKFKCLTCVLAFLAIGTANAQNQLIVPDTASGSVINMTMAPGTMNFYPGVTTQTLGFNGNYLGPTLMLDQGQFVTINITNTIGDTSTVHWHGMHVSPTDDGGPHIYILNGNTWSPDFTVLDRASTYWYHPHLHMRTAEHVTKGAAGFVIVRDADEALLDLPRAYGIDDFPLAVQTRAFDAAGQFIVESALDTSVMVNGTVRAYQSVPAQMVRLRLLNAATERAFNFGFSNNMTFWMIGSDGGLLGAPLPMTRLQMAPGERAEVLIDLAGMTGQSVYLMSYSSGLPAGVYGATNPAIMGPNLITGYTSNPLNGGDFNILRLDVGPALPTGTFTLPTTLVTQTPIPQANADRTRQLLFMPEVMGPTGSLLGPFMINNSMFDINVINDTIIYGDTEIWELTNQTRIAHPFHIHDVQFYILDINGVPPPAHLQGRKDVVLVPGAMGTARFIAEFTDFADPVWPYMYHCHMLTHEDMGMMGQFIVVDTTVSVQEIKPDFTYTVYPNPSGAEVLNVQSDQLKGLNVDWFIHDLSGRAVANGFASVNTAGKFSINPELSSGLYLMTLRTKDGSSSVVRFVRY